MARPATLAARQLGWLFAVAAMLSFATIADSSTAVAAAVIVGVAAMLAAGLAFALPWDRWRPGSELMLLVAATVIVGAATAGRIVPPRSYGAVFILMFAWIGMHRPPRTALWIAPGLAFAYGLPLILTPPDIPFSATGCLVTIGVGATLAEALARTIASRTAVEHASAVTAQTLRVIVDSSPQAMAAIDHDGRCVLANPAAAAATGFALDQMIGANMHDEVHHTRGDGTPYPAEECPIQQAVLGGESVHVEDEWFFRSDGTAFPVEYRAEPIVRDGTVVGAVVTFTDITERRRAERDARARLHDSEKRANTDVLTGVGNRRHARSFLAALRPGDAVVLLDVDHFKRVNDERGHSAGDRILVDLAEHLSEALRAGDELARFGGEEFLLVLSGAGDMADRAVRRIAHEWSQRGSRPTFSAGVAVHRDGESPDETVDRADCALYHAKNNGRNRIVVADDTQSTSPAVV